MCIYAYIYTQWNHERKKLRKALEVGAGRMQ